MASRRKLQTPLLKLTGLFLLAIFICGTVVYFSGKERKYFRFHNKVPFANGDKRAVSQLRSAMHNHNYQVHYNSTSERLLSGGYLQFRHLDDDTNKLSTCQASGEGLHHAEVGIVATVTVQLDQTRINDFNQKYFISVTAISEDHIFVADLSPVRIGDRDVNFTYTPCLPGNYDLYVEEIVPGAPWQKPVPGSPFRLMVQGLNVAIDAFIAHTDNLPSCQTIPQYDSSWIEGAWVTSKLGGRQHGILKSGWVFQPKRCSFDIFTVDEIATAAASIIPKSITILGSSIERGIFLSLTDLLLTMSGRKYIKDSYLDKCWGYMEVELGNLRVIYKDFRIQHSRRIHLLNETNLKIVCYNEVKFTSNYDFLNDTLDFLEDFIFSKQVWPDVIAVTIKEDPQLRLLRSAIPDSWIGVIYPLNSFKLNWATLYTSSGRNRDIAVLTEFATVDSRVQVLDGFILGSGIRRATQSSPVKKSNHENTFCEDLTGDMRICDVTAELVAQVFLAQVLAPYGKNAWT
ncbi:hypothetical protein HOLleu_06361 [Holothuria leucospilota]|uniref:Uncharacterized protein n=1 Tax=Holothuria leucospilota TaxID=206669 RepID=A0A9Q1CL51_HOLLE|nr:hypothetical protein HOLleu_06361 [Holothuria leucospilota]